MILEEDYQATFPVANNQFFFWLGGMNSKNEIQKQWKKTLPYYSHEIMVIQKEGVFFIVAQLWNYNIRNESYLDAIKFLE